MDITNTFCDYNLISSYGSYCLVYLYQVYPGDGWWHHDQVTKHWQWCLLGGGGGMQWPEIISVSDQSLSYPATASHWCMYVWVISTPDTLLTFVWFQCGGGGFENITAMDCMLFAGDGGILRIYTSMDTGAGCRLDGAWVALHWSWSGVSGIWVAVVGCLWTTSHLWPHV